MKLKIIGFAILSITAFSCASKATVTTNAPTQETKEVSLTPTKSVSPMPMPTVVEGKSLYENNCAKCHKLFEPKEFSKEDWAPILVRMQKKAHLDDAQMIGISNYISSQL